MPLCRNLREEQEVQSYRAWAAVGARFGQTHGVRRPVFFAQVLEPGIGLGLVPVVVDRLFDADGSGVEPGREEQQGGDDDDDEGAAELQHCLELSFPASDSIPANVRALNIRPVEPEQHLFRGRQQLFVFTAIVKKPLLLLFCFLAFWRKTKNQLRNFLWSRRRQRSFFAVKRPHDRSRAVNFTTAFYDQKLSRRVTFAFHVKARHVRCSAIQKDLFPLRQFFWSFNFFLTVSVFCNIWTVSGKVGNWPSSPGFDSCCLQNFVPRTCCSILLVVSIFRKKNEIVGRSILKSN